MIKMTRVYGDMYVPREYCTFTNPVTSGGTEEVDYVDMPCENGCEKECENCTLQKIMNEYARLTRQDIDEKKRHCEECENYKEIRKGPLFNPLRGILWKNNVCKLRAHFRTDDKNIKVLKSLKGVDITPEVPEE